MSEENKYGIENLKETLNFMFSGLKLALNLDKNHDGKISVGEIFGAMTSGVMLQLPMLYKSFPFLKNEARDLNDEELKELKDFIVSKDLLPEGLDNLEDLIKDTVNWLHYNYRFMRKFNKYFKA